MDVIDPPPPCDTALVEIPPNPTQRALAGAWRHLIALVALLLCGLAMWTSEKTWSVTADEPVHQMRGDMFWWTGSARLSSAHPPLSNAITSIPFAFDGDEPWKPGVESPTKVERLMAHHGWEQRNPLPLAMAYYGRDYASALAELSTGRRVMILWTLVFAASLYAWCHARWGFTTAIVALLLTLTHPTLLAHGQLVTTDFSATATTFWLIIAWIGWLEKPSPSRMLWFALAGAAMVLTKHSGLVLMVVSSLVILGTAWFGRAGFAGHSSRARRTITTALALVGVALCVLLILAAVYRFERWGMRVDEILATPEPNNWIAKRKGFAMFESTPIAALPGWLRLPMPYDWLAGLATVSAQNQMGHGGYFMGLREQAWHPLYFPVMLAAKTPTAIMLLLGVALGMGLRRRTTLATKVMLLVVVVVLGGACTSRINIGVRHVLPVVPLLIIFAARAAALAWEARARWPRVLVGACLVGNLAGAAWTFPHWLGDFNLLVGGPSGGHRISIVGEDWGQDVRDLAKLANEKGWKRIEYFTMFSPRRQELRAAGVVPVVLRCGKPTKGRYPVAIHLTDYVRKGDNCYGWLGEPDIVINHHILVWEPWAPVATRPARRKPDSPLDLPKLGRESAARGPAL